MALKNYGVLKGRPVDRRLGVGQNPHYQIKVVAGTELFRVAINVKSKQSPSDLLYLVDDRFTHPICDALPDLQAGFHVLDRIPTGGGLDFIRGNLFDPFKMVPLPFNVPGPDNDLNEKFDGVVQRALADESATVYAFGVPWGPEASKADGYFGFAPGRGVHDVHMNQGNSGQFEQDNGVWQDGGILTHFPDQNQWIAVFTAFQSQAWHTDDQTGHPLTVPVPQPGTDPEPLVPTPGVLPTDNVPDGQVRIVGALVNATSSPEREVVTLLNAGPTVVDLAGWQLADKQKTRMALAGTLAAGAVIQIVVVPPVALSNKGGIVTLLDPQGRKVHGVSYTKAQAKAAGWTLTF
ncbi:MAG: DUF2278 family protein [Polyangiaceae bacterium]|nr:DUF2278 family protein [Polyangiaceae bacterium]